jgi:alkanesulfonate monooxygenase SsuD/methylene tetrahydromethanopterin reductase-like flavin-dependent oxidoreductase (luciferase family)
MRLGFALPNIGPLGSPDAVTTVATRAEALGYDSLWTIEPLLYPLQPQSPGATPRRCRWWCAPTWNSPRSP